MKSQTAFIVAALAIVLWFTWDFVLAIALWLFGYGLALLIMDLAPTVVLLVLMVVVGGIWLAVQWLIDQVRRRVK